jgi:AsmA protein
MRLPRELQFTIFTFLYPWFIIEILEFPLPGDGRLGVKGDDMYRVLKWLAIVAAILVVVIVVAVIVAPMVINLETYKPRIEAEASTALNRPVTLGGRIAPSVFPWIGVAIDDVHVGNAPGFEQTDMASIGEFEVRVKLLPLLRGHYEIKRFVLKNPRIVFEQRADGSNNFENLGQPAAVQPDPEPAPDDPTQIPIRSLIVDEFSITSGTLLFIDHGTGARHEITQMNLALEDVALDNAIQLDFSALADGHPLRVRGSVGPLGPEPGQTPIDMDLVATLLNEVQINLQGRLEEVLKAPRMQMHLRVPSFSLRKIFAALDQPLPMDPADPKVLNAIALSMKLSGTPENIRISEGELILDDSRMRFNAQAKAFDKPDLTLTAELDSIDLDRYLPEPAPQEEKPAGPKTPAEAAQIDYTPLRTLVLDARITIGNTKVKNMLMRNMVLKATANNGIIRLDPFSADLYNGQMTATGTVNVQQDKPRSTADFALSNVQAAPLLNDLMDRGLIEGVLTAAVNMRFSGDSPDLILRTLNSKGELSFIEGAIVGVNLTDMVRNVQAAFRLEERPKDAPRTDFSELFVPFSVDGGIAQLSDARLNSPLLRLIAKGKANLIEETLDLRLEPRFVATLEGRDDRERTGIMVPVMIRGTFNDPTFRPDLAAILKQELPGREELEKMIPSKDEIKEDAEKRARELLEQRGQDLLKRMPFGTQPRE